MKMGTRHEIKIICNGELKICQYGQWDGYPEGQGKDIAEFIQGRLVDKPSNMKKFKSAVTACQFLKPEEYPAIEANKNWTKDYPWLSRDAGAKILGYIMDEGARKFIRADETENRSWCEYFYIIDLDNETVQKSKTGKGGKKYAFKDWTPELCSRLK